MIDILKNLNLLDKLVVEHGGSVIFKNHISLLKEQLLILDSEKKDLQIANKDLQIQINDLDKEIDIANKKSEALQKQLDDIHSITISENHEKILLAVANYSGQHPGVFSQIVHMSEQEVSAKLTYLNSLNLLHYREAVLKDQENPKGFGRPIKIWFISKPGHAYIKAHKLNDQIT